MSSAQAHTNQIPANKLYVNISTDIRNLIVDTNLSTIAWAVALGGATPAGTVVLRDMGKTVYLPDPTASSSANGQSTILRKIQWVPSGATGVYGTGAAGSGSAAPGGAQEYYTGYIRLAGQTYGGGDGYPSGCVLLN